MLTVGQETACHAPLGELIAAASSLEEQEQWRGGKGGLQGQGCRVGRVGWMHEKGCFGVVVIPARGEGSVKNRGVGFLTKRDPIWAKRDPIRVKSMKNGQKCSRNGGKNSIICG